MALFNRTTTYEKRIKQRGKESKRNSNIFSLGGHVLKKVGIGGTLAFGAATVVAPSFTIPAAAIGAGVAGLTNKYNLRRAVEVLTYPLRPRPLESDYNEDRRNSYIVDGSALVLAPALVGAATLFSPAIATPLLTAALAPTVYLGARFIGESRIPVTESFKKVKKLLNQPKAPQVTNVISRVSNAPTQKPVHPLKNESNNVGRRKVAKPSLQPALPVSKPVMQDVGTPFVERPRLDESIELLDEQAWDEEDNKASGTLVKPPATHNAETLSMNAPVGSVELLEAKLIIKQRRLDEIETEISSIFKENREILIAFQSVKDVYYDMPENLDEISAAATPLIEKRRLLLAASREVSNELDQLQTDLAEARQAWARELGANIEDLDIDLGDLENPTQTVVSDSQVPAKASVVDTPDFSHVRVVYEKGKKPRVNTSDAAGFSTQNLETLWAEVARKQDAIDAGRRNPNLNGESHIGLYGKDAYDIDLSDPAKQPANNNASSPALRHA